VAAVTLRTLSRRPGVVRELDDPAVITDRGRPIAVLLPLAADAFEDFVFSNVPTFVDALRHADEELAAGETRELDDVLAELDD
jgi:antitoxin (DNA-binding transcriptional repressor) of toxin-antitoxin stability system